MLNKKYIYSTCILTSIIFCFPGTLTTDQAGRESKKINNHTHCYNIDLQRQEMDNKDHESLCSILGYAANIFGHFVNIVKENDNNELISQQVAHIAQNILGIASEVIKKYQKHKADPNNKLLKSLESKEFKEKLEKAIMMKLENI